MTHDAHPSIPVAGARIAHIGVAVTDIAAALPFYTAVLGLVPRPAETADGATIVSIPFGESDVELLQPLTAESPVAKFLEKRGPGIHHVCFAVEDLDAALAELSGKGLRLIHTAPVPGAGGKRVAFLHPDAGDGVLIELAEKRGG